MYSVTKHPLPIALQPTCATHAIKHPYWKHAMLDELTAFSKHNTWDLVPPPPNKTIVACKWIFKVKRNPNSYIERYMARLVAKGFNQRP